MKYGTLWFNDKSNRDVGVKVKGIINYPLVIPIYSTYEVADGTSYRRLIGYQEASIPVTFNVMDRKYLRKIVSDLNDWLVNIKDNKLIFGEDKEFYYVVKTVELDSEFNRTLVELGECQVTFIVEPFRRKLNELNPIPITSGRIIHNDGAVAAKPIIRIEGEGYVVLNVNEQQIKVNVSKHLTIDTERQLCYRDDGTYQNTNISGEYPLLEKGENKITWTTKGTVDKVTIMTNRRYF